MKTMKIIFLLAAIIGAVIFFKYNLPYDNPQKNTDYPLSRKARYDATIKGRMAGFPLGLLHGSIMPLSLILSLLPHYPSPPFFIQGTNIYDVYNNGFFYNFGFCLGNIISAQIIFRAYQFRRYQFKQTISRILKLFLKILNQYGNKILDNMAAS